MHWIKIADTAVFRFINDSLVNPVFDKLMPFASGNKFFVPAIFVAGIVFLWKGGRRARLCGLMLALIVWPGDSFVSNTIKHAIARPRPFVQLENVRVYGKRTSPDPEAFRKMERIGAPADRPGYNSFPSSHAANWFAATMIFFIYYRRSWRIFLPLACLVAFSRLYNGVHFPSDVLGGAIIGAGYAVAGVWAINSLWIWAGRKWFPLWWKKLPSLVNAELEKTTPADSALSTPHSAIENHWLNLGYAIILATLLLNLAYLASGLIELCEPDEAYQWLWSKHLALSYYSKPPMIAYLQFAGTHLFGDTEFGVRFFSPVITAIVSFLLLRFFAREVSARAGVLLLLILQATPLMALGSILMTIDPPSVLFWTAAMLAGWRAVQPDGKTSQWCWMGLWLGLGFLTKYTELFQLLCLAIFFVLWKPARIHLRKPGPYLALLINALCSIPVLIWNAQHGWITLTHLAERGGAGHPWEPTLRYLWDFLGSEEVLLNLFFFPAMIWAAIAFWRRERNDARLIYFFSMGAPLFLCYLLLSFRARVLPNWIAPAVIPLLCISVIYWDKFLQRSRALRIFQTIGIVGGFAFVILLHDTNLVQKIVGKPLPPKPDPMTRVRAFDQVAKIVGAARRELIAKDGKPVFIIGGHYGITGLITFYLPEAKTNAATRPLVYCISTEKPESQFNFWPSYREKCKGQNAIFVREIGGPPLVKGWVWKWLRGETNLLAFQPQAQPAPEILTNEFESVTDLGLTNALYHGRVFHTLQLFECRNLK